MSLTGQPFKWLTIGIAIAASIAVIVMWIAFAVPARPGSPAGQRCSPPGTSLPRSRSSCRSTSAYGGLVASWSDLIDNLMPAQNTWQHNHYRHHGPPAVWAGHRLIHPGPSPLAASAPRESSCVTSAPLATKDACVHLLPLANP